MNPSTPNPIEPSSSDNQNANPSTLHKDAADALGLGRWYKFVQSLKTEWQGVKDGKILFFCLLVAILFVAYRWIHKPVADKNKSLQTDVVNLRQELAPYRSAEGLVKALYPSVPKDERPDKIIELVSQQFDTIKGLQGLVSEDVAKKLGELPAKNWMEMAFRNLNSRMPELKETKFSAYLNSFEVPLQYHTVLHLPESLTLDFGIHNEGEAPLDGLSLSVYIPKDACSIESYDEWRINNGSVHEHLRTVLTNVFVLSNDFERRLNSRTWADLKPIRIGSPKKFTFTPEEMYQLGYDTNTPQGRTIASLPIRLIVHANNATQTYHLWFEPPKSLSENAE